MVLIVAAMSSLNAGLYSTGRVLRSLGMSKQAPQFTLKMSSQGVPWAGIVMTSVVFVFGAVLNFLVPDAFEIALEAAAIGVVFTWGTIFACQLRLRKLVNRGVIPASPFQAPGYPWTSYIGLAFLALVIVGMAVSGWQASPYFWHKTDFMVVVFGIPMLAIVLTIGWRAVKPQVVENTGGRIKAVWSDDGPTYGPTSARTTSTSPSRTRRPPRPDRVRTAGIDRETGGTDMTTSGGGRRGRAAALAVGRAGRVRVERRARTRARRRCRARPGRQADHRDRRSTSPGWGSRTGDTYTGFDVDTAIYVAEALGVPADNITWKEANGDQRQQLLDRRRGGSDRVHLLHHRRAQAGGRLRRAVLRGPPGPAGAPQRDGDHRAGDAGRQGPVLGARHDLGGERHGAATGQHQAGGVPRFSDCVTALANSEVDAVTTDDVILAGFAAQPQYQGKLKVIGKGFSDEIYGVGVKKGNTELVDKVNAALKQYIDDGSWAEVAWTPTSARRATASPARRRPGRPDRGS